MKNIALIMRREAVAQALMKSLLERNDIRLTFEPNYAFADIAVRSNDAETALIEIDESGEYDTSYCLELCVRLRKELPKCKLLIMCPEQDKDSIFKVITAKQERFIDDFVFCDSTITYLSSKLLSL